MKPKQILKVGKDIEYFCLFLLYLRCFKKPLRVIEMNCNYLNRGIILSLALTFFANASINAQNVHLGMTKDSLVMVFGNPSAAGEGTAKSDETVAAADDDSPLPAYYGKSHNLNSLLTLQLSPIEMSYDYRDNTLENRTEAILICKNSDYCDYTIKMSNNSLYRVHEGENIIEGVKGAFRYRYYRGNTVGRIDVKYPYVMPVAPGTKVRFINEQREYHRSFVVLADTGESLHAMRAGRVCLTDDERCILVYHKDGSFAAYMNVEDRCVYPGDSVEPGDPIGKCGAGKMSISLFYLDKNKINDNAWSYTHFTPYFRTAEADVKLETDVEYVSYIDDDIITKEMSRLRKKIYLHGTK